MIFFRVVHEERELKRVGALFFVWKPCNNSKHINKSRCTSVSQNESNSLLSIAKEHPRLKRLFEDWKAAHASNESSSQFFLGSSPAQSSTTVMHS